MFRTRLISGIVLVIIALAVIITGGNVLLGTMAVISLIGMYELYRVFGIEKSLAGFVGYIACLVYYGDLLWKFLPEHMILPIVFLIIMLGVYVFTYPKYKADQIMAGFFGLFYVAIMLSFLYQTRMLERGAYLVWLIFLCSWGCDTCAYCVGVLFGKHKMAPVLSPKKSIEGAVGGVVGSMLLTVLYCYIFRNQMEMAQNEVYILAVVSGIGALISMIGDLAASAIKRNYDIKDYGKLIPGHGGILDRFDSVIITAPIVYFLASNLL
ncbi:MAG: phosphatidate cytidylyltransferase [Lachnospiraceae bacterium]|nr:phosphatidate cytidylyltransferase [Lachnospiraceae bacterium]